MTISTRALHVLLFACLVIGALLIVPGLAAAHQAPEAAEPEPQLLADGKPYVVTAGDGGFRFEGLARGTHQVFLDAATLPPKLRPAADAAQVVLWLNPGQSLISDPIGSMVRFSATYDPDGRAISGVVFVDENLDGRQSPGEAGLPGITVIDPEIHQYIIPGDDRNLIGTFFASNECQPSSYAVGNFLASRISITASSNGTIYYYDHWEDGYDDDPVNPEPDSSTEIGALAAGETVILEDDINTADPNWGTTLYYDGRDRITIVGDPASVIRAAFPSLTDSPIGSRLAGAWEVDEVSNWGMRYIIPAGEDWGPGSDFEFTAAGFTALQEGTEIYRNGSMVAVLNEGETYGVPGGGDGPGGGGLDSGEYITATAPIQAHLYASICDTSPSPTTGGRIWSGNGYTLRSLKMWTNDYWSPVPRRTSSDTCRFDANVDMFLYNNTGVTINLTIDDGTVPPLAVPLPPGSSSVSELIAPALLSDSRGVHLTGDGPFWGMVNFDTRSIDFEWGYSLIPADELSSLVVLGWAPGNDAVPPLGQYPPNGNLAFVTAVADTTVFVDLDQDGTPDNIDCNGDGDATDWGVDGVCNEPESADGIDLLQGQTLRVADPIDALLRGTLIYTTDLSQKIAVAWGEDSCVASPGLPYLDLGYTVLPAAVSSLSKEGTVVEDVDGSGDNTPGDIVEYTVVIVNRGWGPMNNVVMTDTLPYTATDFVVGSIFSTPPFLDDDYFDGSSWGYDPTPTGPFGVDSDVQQFRLTWPVIDAQQKVTTTFRVQIHEDLPPEVTEFRNVVLACSDNTGCNEAEAIIEVGQPILQIDKLPSDPTTVRPGGTLTYTVLAANVGTATATDTIVGDVLPPWLTFVPNTLDMTWPVAHVIQISTPITSVTGIFTPTYGDNFDLPLHIMGTTGYTGTDGTVPWLTDWTEFNDDIDGSPNNGDIQVIENADEAQSPYGFLRLTDESGDDVEAGVRRCASLFGFVEPHLSYQLWGHADNTGDDVYRVAVRTTAATITITEFYDGGAYVFRDLDISDFADNSPVCVSFVAGSAMEGLPKQYRIDNVFIYDATAERYETFYLIEETTVISYLSVTNTSPAAYTRIPDDPTTAAIEHTMQFTNAFPFPAQSSFTATFQMMVGYPLTDGLQMQNTACVTATNLVTEPYPLCDTVTTTVQSSHVLNVEKQDDPDEVRTGDTLTYTIEWEIAGDEPAPGVVVTDVLPSENVSFVSCAGGLSCSHSDGVVVWDLGDQLPPLSQITYASGLLTLTVHVDQAPVISPCLFTNTVFIEDATDTPGDRDDEPTSSADCDTAIELLYFRAGPKAGGVLVEWATLFEIDTYGFWLYRSTDVDLDHAIPVAFVPSKGWQGLGAVYSYLDADLSPGQYHYWLVEVENGGKRTTYGPVSSWSGWDDGDLPHRIYLPLVLH